MTPVQPPPAPAPTRPQEAHRTAALRPPRGSTASGLELPQGPTDQHLDWWVERIGQAAFTTLILAALVGLLGHGPLSTTTAGKPGGPLRVEYNRFERYQGPTDLCIRITPEVVRDGRLRIWLDRSFLESLEIERVDPAPEVVELGADRHTYVFAAPALGGLAAVTFRYKPRTIFQSLRARIGIEGGTELEFRQFVYP